MKHKSKQAKPAPSQEETVAPDKKSSDLQEELNKEWADKLPCENDPNWED
jgi:hypothetical protein